MFLLILLLFLQAKVKSSTQLTLLLVQVSVLEIILFFLAVIVNDGFSTYSSYPWIGVDICTMMKMQAKLTSAIVNHKQVNLE